MTYFDNSASYTSFSEIDSKTLAAADQKAKELGCERISEPKLYDLFSMYD